VSRQPPFRQSVSKRLAQGRQGTADESAARGPAMNRHQMNGRARTVIDKTSSIPPCCSKPQCPPRPGRGEITEAQIEECSRRFNRPIARKGTCPNKPNWNYYDFPQACWRGGERRRKILASIHASGLWSGRAARTPRMSDAAASRTGRKVPTPAPARRKMIDCLVRRAAATSPLAIEALMLGAYSGYHGRAFCTIRRHSVPKFPRRAPERLHQAQPSA